ncbi:MAG TPA: PKD domain-containing protein [Candidatus Angelobacter sp.]|nr:PKD domain-containing protein [Candidatus Angelobacter sp.]
MYRSISLLALILFSSLLANASTPFKATTTLAAETGNNTSAAASFTGQSNSNIAGTNISKVATRTLLYPGSTTKIYVNFLPWFGFGDHVSVGYVSNDPAQVQKQVDDMVSRGLDGAIIDWYGRGTFNSHFVSYDQSSQQLMHQAEQHPGFNFAVMDDAVSLQPCAATSGCDVTQTLIDDLNYANVTYMNSPAYLHWNGRPVLYFFGHESLTIDWNRVRAGVAGNPVFIFRNSSGFTRAQSDGGYSWIEPTQTGTAYLDGFYTTAQSLINEFVTGSGYKGFDDSIAAWTQHRLMQQQCGQTWLSSITEAGKYYSASSQLLGIQIVTWNDYEEGSEVETGIDNCVAVSAAVSGNALSWSITGQMNTVDHFTVFASQDGQNLMWLADAPTTTASLDLAQLGLPAGNYTMFVKAVGKPSLTNKMSAGVSYTAGGSTPPPPVAVLNVTPLSGIVPLAVAANTTGSSAPGGSIASITIDFGDGSASVNGASANHTYGTAGNYTVTATVTDSNGASTAATAKVTAGSAAGNLSLTVPSGGSAATIKAGQSATFALQLAATGSPFSVTITCSGAPTSAACNGPASPLTVAAGSSVSVPVTVTTTANAAMLPLPVGKTAPPMLWLLPGASVLAWLIGGKARFVQTRRRFAGSSTRQWKPAFAALLLLLAVIVAMAGCGGSKGSTATKPVVNGTPVGAYTLTVTATSGSTTRSAPLTLNVQ